MGKYVKQIWISAPREDVIDAIKTPDTWRVIVPSMQDAEVTEADDDGYRLDFTYKLGGVRIKRAIETGEAEADDQWIFELTGMITGTYTFDISEQGTGTRVKFDAQYNVSNRVLERITRRFANRYVTRQLDSLLSNLKHYLEMEKAEIEPGPIET